MSEPSQGTTTEANQATKQPLALPAPSDDDTARIEVNGQSFSLFDRLGPTVVNSDGVRLRSLSSALHRALALLIALRGGAPLTLRVRLASRHSRGSQTGRNGHRQSAQTSFACSASGTSSGWRPPRSDSRLKVMRPSRRQSREDRRGQLESRCNMLVSGPQSGVNASADLVVEQYAVLVASKQFQAVPRPLALSPAFSALC
jgi:hypothetical protein